MSREVAKDLVRRANEDKIFMQKLLDNPTEILKGYDLSEAEREFFLTADRKAFEGLSDKCFELAE